MSGPAVPALVDRFDRPQRSLRLSVTDRCNLRCRYCIPTEAMTWLPRPEILTFEEITTLVTVAAGLGVREVKLTGGEPTLRKGLPDLVRMLTAIPGIAEVSLTTNGVVLPGLLPALQAAGLRRVTVSLDTLNRERFRTLTRRDALGETLAALDALEAAGLHPVKLNTVIMRGVNEDEGVDFAALAYHRPIECRFIEFMPLDSGRIWTQAALAPGAEVQAAIAARYRLIPLWREGDSAPSRDYALEGGKGKVGFINPMTQPFCGNCDRLRLTGDGKLRNCLFDRGEVDLRGPLRAGASAADLAERIRRSVAAKAASGVSEVNLAAYDPGRHRSMSQIAG